ncbi:MAG: M48 family metalloprotease [Alphaproteobacteria bacterium]
MKRIRVPKAAAGFVAFLCIALITLSGQTSAKNISIIRDTEIENTIRVYSAPLFEAAGLQANDISIHIVNDPTLNAFVAGGQRIFMNTGLLMRAGDASQVIGVIAHETGHISGGHLVRLQERLRNSTAQSILAMILGGVAAVASGEPGAAQAVIAGSATIQQRTLLSYTRTMEQSADQAGFEFLESTGMSARGLLAFLEILSGQESLSASRQDPYVRSHPLTRDRIEFLREQIARSPNSDKPVSEHLTRAHDRMQAKLKGYLNPLSRTLRDFPETDTSVPARYARAIGYKEKHQVDQALAHVDSLLAEAPNDPFFHELKGDILQDAGKVADSIPSYRRAIEILPWAALIRINLAQSLLEMNNPAMDNEALVNLNEALRYEPEIPLAWRLKSTAFSRSGDQAHVMLALAEEAMLTGKKNVALYRAERAMELLQNGSASWVRAQDIRNAAQKAED